jgi:C-terminal processing protease CtpA/Prc
MPGIFTAKAVTTPDGIYGYVRIWSFSVDNAKTFVQEFLRLVAQLPQTGLIIDVRGNGGGLILAGDELLQVLTPQSIQPTLYQVINTPLNLELCRRNDFLSQWVNSIGSAVRTAATYSSSFAITAPEDANAIGQHYHGPVVLITDALCYSTTDIFAAGFQDHVIGPILGVDDNTGAGGANVWTHSLLMRFLPAQVRKSFYHPLPGNSGMRVSIRRSLRVGNHTGTPIEDLGVVPDYRHHMTRQDLLAGNQDLIARAAELLANLPVRRLTINGINQSGDGWQVALTTLGIKRLDIHVNGRPQGSVDIEDCNTDIMIANQSSGTLGLFGYADGKLVAARRHSL